MTHMTAKEYQDMLVKEAGKKKQKYHNKYVYVYEDGFVSNCKTLCGHGQIIENYASEKEYARYKELLLLQRSGRISNLQKQVPILLMEGFKDSTGKKIQPIYYVADFSYTEDGEDIIEDVKGVDKKTGKQQTTKVFLLKWKLLKAKYPNKTFRIY